MERLAGDGGRVLDLDAVVFGVHERRRPVRARRRGHGRLRGDGANDGRDVRGRSGASGHLVSVVVTTTTHFDVTPTMGRVTGLVTANGVPLAGVSIGYVRESCEGAGGAGGTSWWQLQVLPGVGPDELGGWGRGRPGWCRRRGRWGRGGRWCWWRTVLGVASRRDVQRDRLAGEPDPNLHHFTVLAGQTNAVPPVELNAPTGSISGTVVWNGSPATGAGFSISAPSFSAYADYAGQYSVANLVAGD